MNQAIEDLFVAGAGDASWGMLVLNLVLCAVLAAILQRVYVKYGHAISNRKAFARNFMLLTMTTMLIITIVQSSLALSLGLIGALSIVRFRAAIKEPEELSYLFLAIATGLGLGAGQLMVTLLAFATIVSAIKLRDMLFDDRDAWEQSAYLTVATALDSALSLEAIREVVEDNTTTYRLKRFDQAPEGTEAFFLLEFRDAKSFGAIHKALREADTGVRITFLDHRGGAVAAS